MPINTGDAVDVDSNSSTAHGCVDNARMADEFARGRALDEQVLIYTQYYNYIHIKGTTDLGKRAQLIANAKSRDSK